MERLVVAILLLALSIAASGLALKIADLTARVEALEGAAP